MEVNPRNNNNEVVLIDIFDIKPSNPPSIDLDNVFRQFDIKINEPTITVKDDDLIMKDYENIFIKKTKKNDKKLNDNKPITNNKTEESNVGNPSKPSNKPTTNNKTEESNVGNPTKSSNKPISDNKQPLNLLDMMKPTNNKQPLNLLDIMKPTNNTLNNNQSLNLLDSMKPTNNTLNNKAVYYRHLKFYSIQAELLISEEEMLKCIRFHHNFRCRIKKGVDSIYLERFNLNTGYGFKKTSSKNKFFIIHFYNPCNNWHKGADNRNEPGCNNCQCTVFFIELLGRI